MLINEWICHEVKREAIEMNRWRRTLKRGGLLLMFQALDCLISEMVVIDSHDRATTWHASVIEFDLADSLFGHMPKMVDLLRVLG